jgi:hypothetical protein
MAVGVVAAGWQATWYNHTFRVVVLSFLLVSVFGVFAFGFRRPRCRTSLVHNNHFDERSILRLPVRRTRGA